MANRRVYWRSGNLCEDERCPCRHVAEIDLPERKIKAGDQLCLTGEPFLNRVRNDEHQVVSCDSSTLRRKP